MRARLSRHLGITAGVVLALVVLVLLFPIGCGSSDEGFPPEGPDPNAADCSTIAFESPSWGHLKGGDPATDARNTTYDVLWRQMTLRAVAIAAVPLAIGIFVDLVRSRRRRD